MLGVGVKNRPTTPLQYSTLAQYDMFRDYKVTATKGNKAFMFLSRNKSKLSRDGEDILLPLETKESLYTPDNMIISST
jgi:hypothetical protein